MAQKLVETQWDRTAASATTVSSTALGPSRRGSSVLARVGKYSAVRAVVLLLTVAIAVYITILVANMGGFVDEIKKTNIDLALMGVSQSGALRDMSPAEKVQYIDQARAAMIQAEGLNDPFILRCFRWLRDGLTMNWGDSKSEVMREGIPTHDARAVILDALPRTLLIFGLANFFLFFTSIFIALALVKHHGRWLDRLIIVLSPMSSAPAWIYGIILNMLFLRLLGTSLGGAFDAWPSEFRFAYIPMILKHMLLPFLAILLSGLFQSIYAWRAFFHLYSNEDYVEMAKAKGLSARTIERRYILRSALPGVLTSFALMMVTLWQEIIALELFFDVSGIGQLFYVSLRRFDMPIILGLVVTFAYLLAITIFALDILYSLVDPRVRVGTEERTARSTFQKRRQGLRFWADRKRGPARGHTWRPRRARVILWARIKGALSALISLLRDSLHSLKGTLAEISNHPSAVLGLSIIAALVCASVATVFSVPYDEAIALWRGDQNVWYRTPADAAPEWVNHFRRNKLPETIVLDSRGKNGIPGNPADRVANIDPAGTVSKSRTVVSDEMTDITLLYTWDYPYDGFPQDLVIRFDTQYHEKKPLLTLSLATPDGREIDLGTLTIVSSQAFYVSQQDRLKRQLKTDFPQQALFVDPNSERSVAIKGTYQLKVQAAVFEEEADLDGEMTVYGQVYGLAGTDGQRRDLMIPLLWGMPVALAFGLLAAVGTTVSSIVIAAIGAWFGGWVDGLVQRITEVNMILPFIPVSIMIFTLYSKSFWVILGVTVLLSIFGNAIKNYRAIFLQVRQAPYIEAAQAYGAGNARIVFRYLIPRISAILVPQLVILVPGYVFLEATLAFLQVSDPLLPTWGKLIVNALSWGAFNGNYHLILEPAGLLLLTGFAFAIVGFSLERIFEPRLRER